MKPAPFRYVAARSLEQALALKAEHGDEARFLAGGQSLVPAMNFRLTQPAVLIDINPLNELAGIRNGGDRLRIGALTRYRSLERDPMTQVKLPLIAEALPVIAHPQIRNRGTIGGNLAHADPASEMPAIVLTLGGRLHAQSVRGERWIEARDFFVGALTTALEPDEMLTEVELPVAAARFRRLLSGNVAPARRFRHHRRRLHGAARRARPLRRSAHRAVQRRRRSGLCRRRRVARWPANKSASATSPKPPRWCKAPSILAAASMPARSISAMSPACSPRALWRPRTNGRGVSTDRHEITVTVNGTPYRRSVESRLLLSDFLRHDLLLAGTHVGCEHGVCGACTVIVDGAAVRSCLMFAAQADGRSITTVEGLAPDQDHLHPLQESMRDCHGLQCGYCTPGILMTMKAFLDETPSPDEAQIREALSGNLCRCTGYQHIVEAMQLAAERLRGSST